MKRLLAETEPMMDRAARRWRKASLLGKVGQSVVLLVLTGLLMILLYRIKCALGIDIFANGGVHDAIGAIERKIGLLLLG